MPTRSTLALLMTDVQGSTAAWQAHPDAMNAAMKRHHEIAASVVASHGGEFPPDQGEGDARFAAFPSASAAVEAAVDFQRALAAEPWPEPVTLTVRMGVHVGEVIVRDGNLFGDPVNRCARIRGLGHGGQVLVSGTAAALARPALPEPIRLVDMGLHRMKDLTSAEQIFAVEHPDLGRDFPPLSSLDRARHNLPVQLSSFVGRDEQLAELTRLVLDRNLVTITGFGGMGKTRTALQVGAELAEGDGDGVWFVDLSTLRDPDLLLDAVAGVLGVDTGGGDVQAAVLAHLTPRRLLLILDNVEQLLPRAASTIAALASAGADSRVLVTSREPLMVRGEHVYPLPPLDGGRALRPGEDAIGMYDAVTLFIDRASSADPHFVVDERSAPAIAAICHELDGWPLAIELAAARVRSLGLDNLLQRLGDRLAVLTGGSRDAPERQRTLRETIAWSVELLPPRERTLLARLSVTGGPAQLELVEALAGDDLRDGALDVLASLQDKSLVHLVETEDGARYSMLDSIREFASGVLAEDGQTENANELLAACVHRLCDDLEHPRRVFRSRAEDVPNIDAALRYLIGRDAARAAELLVVSTRTFHHCAPRQGTRWSEQVLALDLDETTRHEVAVMDALTRLNLGDVNVPTGDLLPHAEALVTRPGARPEPPVYAAFIMSSQLADEGDAAGALQWAEACLRLTEGRTDRLRTTALNCSGYAYWVNGELDRAVEAHREAVACQRKAGDLLVYPLGELARTLVEAGRPEEAMAPAAEAIALAQSMSRDALGFALGALGRAQVRRGLVDEGLVALTDALRAHIASATYCPDLAWLAVAAVDRAPDLGALAFGAALGLTDRHDLWPPAELLDPVRAAYERDQPDLIARGRALGWRGLYDELGTSLETPVAEPARS